LFSADSNETKSDDYALMRAISARDQSALRTLYDRHSPLIFTLLMRILHNRADADELLTDIFWEIWEHADRFDSLRGSPRTYFITLARSRAIDRLRNRARQVPTMQMSDSPAVAVNNAAEDGEQARIVRSALDNLDAAQRKMIEYAFYEGLSHSEIAAKTQQPLGTVKTYIRRGLIQLRDSLRTLDGKSS
jgi:RNA polymerase sigma-70 factor (ECF subfamily)